MDCKKQIAEYLKCMRKVPANFPCEDKCKIIFMEVIKCLEMKNKNG